MEADGALACEQSRQWLHKFPLQNCARCSGRQCGRAGTLAAAQHSRGSSGGTIGGISGEMEGDGEGAMVGGMNGPGLGPKPGLGLPNPGLLPGLSPGLKPGLRPGVGLKPGLCPGMGLTPGMGVGLRRRAGGGHRGGSSVVRAALLKLRAALLKRSKGTPQLGIKTCATPCRLCAAVRLRPHVQAGRANMRLPMWLVHSNVSCQTPPHKPLVGNERVPVREGRLAGDGAGACEGRGDKGAGGGARPVWRRAGHVCRMEGWGVAPRAGSRHEPQW